MARSRKKHKASVTNTMKKVLSLIFFTLCTFIANAQSVTYNHDATKMNQFMMQETGTGTFQSISEWYYDAFHSNYKSSLLSTNKSLYRTQAYEASYQQTDYADSIRVRLESRAKEEAINMADRQLDVAWLTEQSKIENALLNYRNNLSLLSTSGVSAEEKNEWEQYANIYDFAIERTKHAYMANSERQKEYLNIYDEIARRNIKLVKRVRYLKALSKSNDLLDARATRERRVQQCINEAYNKWRDAGSSVKTANR